MEYSLWKNERKVNDKRLHCVYSIRREGYFSLVLSESDFSMLFPDINKENIPLAPQVVIMTVEAKLMRTVL